MRGGCGAQQSAFHPGQFGGDAVLLDLEEVEGDGTGVVRLQQLGSLVDESLALGRQLDLLTAGLLALPGQFFAQKRLNPATQLAG